MADIDDEIARLRQTLRATSDSGLADILGVGRSTISQWRKRGAIPETAKIKAAHVASHIDQYANSAAQVALLEPTIFKYSRALAIAFAYRHSSKPPYRIEDELPRIASALDHFTLAAAKAMSVWMNETGISPVTAFETLLIDGNLERGMMSALLPSELPQ